MNSASVHKAGRGASAAIAAIILRVRPRRQRSFWPHASAARLDILGIDQAPLSAAAARFRATVSWPGIEKAAGYPNPSRLARPVLRGSAGWVACRVAVSVSLPRGNPGEAAGRCRRNCRLGTPAVVAIMVCERSRGKARPPIRRQRPSLSHVPRLAFALTPNRRFCDSPACRAGNAAAFGTNAAQ